MERLIESFVLYDQYGRTYKARLIQGFMDTSSAEGRSAAPGLKRYELSDGTPLNPAAEGAFLNIGSGEILRRTRPKAS
jgi:hypothetical protein